MLTCRVCQTEKPETEFYSASKVTCKICYRARVTAYQKTDKHRAYEARRYRENPARRAAIDAYAKTERGKQVLKASKKAWSERNPEKRRAQIAVGNAVRDGRLAKPSTCSLCGVKGLIHGHHADYTKPLEVTWLCSPCHKREHS